MTLLRIIGKELRGSIKAPPSKSYTHRALVCASLANGFSEVVNPLICDDTLATINALISLGIDIAIRGNYVEVYGGSLKPRVNVINCYESGTTLRFITAISALTNELIFITGYGSLLRRPIGELVRALNSLGGRVGCSNDYPPVVTFGRVKGGKALIRGDISSQFISSLLLISPLALTDVSLEVFNLESKPYVLMTLDVQKSFGVNVDYVFDDKVSKFYVRPSRYVPTEFVVEGDWSSTSYFLVGATISGEVRVEGVSVRSLQADKAIVDVLKSVGASLRLGDDWVEVSSNVLEGFHYDVRDSPDLLPTLAVLAAVSRGTSRISGISRCRFKESDRVEAVVSNLRRLGITANVLGDELVIKGVERVRGGIIESYDDHRVAMAFSLLSLKSSEGLVINNAFSVSKSYPSFWRDLRSLGVDVEVVTHV